MSDVVAEALEKARLSEAGRRRAAAESCAAWLVRTGWRLEVEHFEDELATWPALTEEDRERFHAERASIIEASEA